MKYHINLSRQPFYNRKLFWLSFLFIISFTGLAINSLKDEIQVISKDSKLLEARVTEQRRRLKDLQSAAPVKAQPLDQAHIKQMEATALLIAQRRFSWTSMLEEFERALSPQIRIASISLADKVGKGTGNNDKTKGVQLSLQVFANNPEEITKMIEAMDKRGIFQVQPKIQLAPQPDNPDTGFELLVQYLPTKKEKGKERTQKNIKLAKERVSDEGDDDE